MTKLTDTQLVILSAAAGRDDRAVLPGMQEEAASKVDAALRAALNAEIEAD